MENFEKQNTPENLQKEEQILHAPEGWQTDGSLAQKLKISNRTTERIGNRYRDSNPEYFVQYKDNSGRVWEYYSPELVEIIREEAQKYTMAPEGWMANTRLSNNLGIGKVLSKKIADIYRDSNPEYFSHYKDKTGKAAEYYSPELVKIITEEVKKYDKAPEGWQTTGFISGTLNAAFTSIQKIADPYHKTNPEYFKQFRDASGKVSEHYSPELVEIIINEVKKIPMAPVGWATINSLVDSLGVDYSTITKIADMYQESNPEYFADYRTKTIAPVKHYAPELVKIITETVGKYSHAPKEWMTAGEITKGLGFHNRVITRIADSYRRSNPEYFQKFKGSMGRTFEHYSPELVELIKKESGKENNILESPENWKPVQDIAEKMGVSKEEAEKIAKKLRDSYPGQFGKFRDKSKDAS